MNRLFLAAMFSLVGACSGGDPDAHPPPLAPGAVPVLVERRDVATGRTSRLLVHAAPDAACELRPLHSRGVDDHLEVVADGAGDVRFSFRPDPETTVGEAILECEAPDGSRTSQRLELHASAAGVGTTDDDALPRNGVVRAPLDGDLQAYSDDEIRARGFRPRPHADADPTAYARWVKDATRPMLVVPPSNARTRLQGGPHLAAPAASGAPPSSAGDFRSANWAGCLAAYPPASPALRPYSPYVWASGEIIVPDPVGSERTSALATWIGLGGYWGIHSTFMCSLFGYCHFGTAYTAGPANTPLIQAGVFSQAAGGEWFNTHAFFEYWTATGGYAAGVQLSFYVNPGDTLYVVVMALDAGGAISTSGAYGGYEIIDESVTPIRSSGFLMRIQPGTAVPYMGESADWIAERPSLGALGGKVPDLARYGETTITFAAAQTAGYSYTGPTQTMDMDNTDVSHDYYTDDFEGNTLATARIDTVPVVGGGQASVCITDFLNAH